MHDRSRVGLLCLLSITGCSTGHDDSDEQGCRGGKCDGPVCSGTSTPWSHSYGDATEQSSLRTAVATDPCGGVVIAGGIRGTADLHGCQLAGDPSTDAFVARIGENGDCVWAKQVGTPTGFESALDVALDPMGNVLVTGIFGDADVGGGVSGPVVVAKYQAGGDYLWSKTAEFAYGTAVAADRDGNVIVTGICWGTLDFGGGPLPCHDDAHTFVAKFDAAGAHVWSRVYTAPGNWNDDDDGDGPASLAVDSMGNIVLAGSFNVIDFGGGEVTSTGYAAAFVVKLDAAGNHVWTRTVRNGEDERANAVAVDSVGNVVVVGSYLDPGDFFGLGPISTAGKDVAVVKFDPAGNLLWHHHYTDASGARNGQYATGIAIDPAGNVSITGLSSGDVDFGGGVLGTHGDRDVFLVRLDPSGNHLASRMFGGSGDDVSESIAADGTHQVVISGMFQDAIDVGTGPLTSAGGYDLFLAKIAM